jgi:hypothetical protein
MAGFFGVPYVSVQHGESTQHMPYLSNNQLQESLAVRDNGDEREERSSSPHVSIVPIAGGMGAAAIIGFVRAKFEDPATGQWNLPGTQWDAEAVAFVTATSLAFGGKFIGLGSQARTFAALGAIGIGSHYFGEVARRYGRTGKLDWHVGGGVPPWDPTSFDPTQFANPHDDDAAGGLASSGV